MSAKSESAISSTVAASRIISARSTGRNDTRSGSPRTRRASSSSGASSEAAAAALAARDAPLGLGARRRFDRLGSRARGRLGFGRLGGTRGRLGLRARDRLGLCARASASARAIASACARALPPRPVHARGRLGLGARGRFGLGVGGRIRSGPRFCLGLGARGRVRPARSPRGLLARALALGRRLLRLREERSGRLLRALRRERELRRGALFRRSKVCEERFAVDVGVAIAHVLDHLADRSIEVSSLLENAGEAAVGVHILRVEPDRRAEVLLGAGVVLALVQQHATEAKVGVRVVRVELDAALERLVRRLARPPARLHVLDHPDHGPRRAAHLGAPLLDGRAIHRERLVPLLLLQQRLARRRASP